MNESCFPWCNLSFEDTEFLIKAVLVTQTTRRMSSKRLSSKRQSSWTTTTNNRHNHCSCYLFVSSSIPNATGRNLGNNQQGYDIINSNATQQSTRLRYYYLVWSTPPFMTTNNRHHHCSRHHSSRTTLHLMNPLPILVSSSTLQVPC
jgi:hypothetical protein